MKKIFITAFVVMIVLISSAVPVFAAEQDPSTGNGFTVVGTPHFVAYSGEVDSASALSAILAQLTSPDQALDYLSTYNSTSSYVFMPNYVVNIKYNATHGVYGIYLSNKNYSGWLHTGNRTSGRYMVYCPANKFEPDLLYSISRSVSTISSTVSTISSNISSMLSGVTGIGGKLDTVIDLLTNTEYCCGYDTNSSGTAFPQQTISYSIAEQIVARLNTTMQGKMVKLLKRDGSGASNATFVRAYISDTNYIKIQVASGSALLCDSKNTIFKVGTNYLSSIYSRVNAMKTSLANAVTRLDSLLEDSGAILTAVKALPDYSAKLDTIADLLTTTEYCCGYDTNPSGTAFPQQTISYSIAEQIVARLNTTMQGKMVKLLKRDGSGASNAVFVRAYISDTNYIKIQVASGSALLCDSTNTIFKVGTDYVSGIYARLNSANTSLTSIDSRLSTLHTDNTGFVGIFNSIDNSLGDLNVKLGGLKADLGGLEVNITGGSSGSVDLTNVENALTSVIDKLDNLPAPSPAADLTGVTDRLDAIITLMQATGGEYNCQHTYTQEMEQEATCGLPGLMVSTCSKCGNSYSEIVSALGHDWVCTEHVAEVKDPDTEEVTQAGYDIYTCSRCGQVYEDHSGDGAPADYGDTSISKIIVSLFSKLGTFAGKLVAWVVDLFTKTLGGINDLFTRFSELTEQITSVGGDYPTWLTGFWGVLPQELQLMLTFAFLCIFVGIIGRKLFFS